MVNDDDFDDYDDDFNDYDEYFGDNGDYDDIDDFQLWYCPNSRKIGPHLKMLNPCMNFMKHKIETKIFGGDSPQ